MDTGRAAAFEILLLLADADARWGDYGSALSLVDTAAAFAPLPPEYDLKRSRWARLDEITGVSAGRRAAA